MAVRVRWLGHSCTLIEAEGTKILIEDGARVHLHQKVAEAELHNIPIICDRPGYVKYEDLVEGISTERDVNKQTT